MFIKAPEVLFEFPLLAIAMDWLELAVILKANKDLSTEAYLKTHKCLRRVFFIISLIVVACIGIDILAAMNGLWIISTYHVAVSCFLSLVTASFSAMVLSMFIFAYISLVRSINQIRYAISEMTQ